MIPNIKLPHRICGPFGTIAALTALFSAGTTNAATVDSSAFAGSAGSLSISTSGSLGYGYFSVDDTVFLGAFGASSGTAVHDNTLFGSIFELDDADTFGNTTLLTTVGGSYTNVTLTEGGLPGAPSNKIDSRSTQSAYTFDGNNSWGSFGGFAGNEQDVWTLAFNDLGVGTFDITLYLDHSNSGRIFDMDYNLAGVTGTTTMGSSIGTLNGGTGTAFTYTISATTTSATDDLTLTFGSVSGGSGQGFLAGYTVVPEPSSALLGGLGALFLLRRRRI